jgi:hypothetical protein
MADRQKVITTVAVEKLVFVQKASTSMIQNVYPGRDDRL